MSQRKFWQFLTFSITVISCLALSAFALGAARAAAADEPTTTFNLRDFGAVGDGSTDDGPALQSALDALAAAGGGTLRVPAGRYVIASPVHRDFAGLAASISIHGVESNAPVDTTLGAEVLSQSLDLVSEFYPRTHEEHVAVSVGGLRSFLVQDIAFVGTPDITTDAAVTLDFDRVGEARVRHCEFYGLSTFVEGGAVVRARRSGLHVEQTKFLGSIGSSGLYVPVVENLEWKGVALTDVVFLDYGLRPELFGKTGYGAPFSWVNVGNAAATSADSPRREVVVRRAFLDEGGFVGLSSLPRHYQPPSAPIDLYYITGLRMNVSNLGAAGHYLDGLKGLLVEDSRYGWTHNADAAIHLLNTDTAILDRVHTEAAATRLRAGAGTGRLTVIDSVYADLASEARATRVLDTEADGDDPVWHVRRQFLSALGREPDAAAHFYWADQILQCGEADAACVADRRAALDAYLAAAPAPTFDITGRVADEDGTPVPGLTVTLSGSQSVSTEADADGRFRFLNLPTSGVYTVTTSKRHHTFAPRTFVTPGGDRSADLTAVPDRHAVRGRLVEGDGAPISGASVTLDGPGGGAATTDHEGNYSFENVAAGGSYTVAPSKLGYRFTPPALSVVELDADRAADFGGAKAAYTLDGRVTTAGGSAAGGVLLTVTGSRLATATTDAAGNYSVPGLLAGGAYAVTPSGAGLASAPASASFTNLSANVTADFTVRVPVNHALAANGATVTASSTLDANRAAAAAINGDRSGVNWGADPAAGSGWHDATADDFPDWLEVAFAGPRTISEVSVFSVQDNYWSPSRPAEALTFARYGVTDFRVEYWDGAAWQVVPGGLFVANHKVWAKVNFAPLSTTRIRVVVDGALAGYSRIAEVEAWGESVPPPFNHALAANGATVIASSTLDAGRAPEGVIDGERAGRRWGAGGGWHDATPDSFPDWLQINFGAAKTVREVSVFSVQDNYSSPSRPAEALTFARYGVTDFHLEYWDGAAWRPVPGAAVTGNDRVWRRLTFEPVSTQGLRVVVDGALGGYSRVTEVEVY